MEFAGKILSFNLVVTRVGLEDKPQRTTTHRVREPTSVSGIDNCVLVSNDLICIYKHLCVVFVYAHTQLNNNGETGTETL